MDLSIKQKLFLMACGSAIAAAATGATGIFGMARVSDAAERMQQGQVAMRNQMQADMMHDALRADVLNAIITRRSGGNLNAVQQDLTEHAASFRESLAKLDAVKLTVDVERALREVRPPLDAYITDAEAIVRIAAAQDADAALARLPAFAVQFTTLEEAMEQLDEKLEASAAAEIAATHALESKTESLAAVIALLGAGLIFAAGWVLQRNLLGTLRTLGAHATTLRTRAIAPLGNAMSAMARGDVSRKLDVKIERLPQSGTDELAALGATLDGVLVQTQETIAAYETARQALDDLIDETMTLATAGRNGELSVRGDTKRFSGAYAILVEGINDTLDAALAPIAEATEILEAMAERDFSREMRGQFLGEHARIKDALNTAVREMRAALIEMRDQASRIGDSSQELSAVSTQLTASAATTARLASLAETSGAEVSESVQHLATGSEEIGSSIREIAASASEAARVAGEAVRSAVQTNENITRLGASSAEIGDVIRTITGIAEQTNLLALNATIEAARAGEAGKGFAVVANEVKELAKATARATEDIGARIAAIQEDVGGAVTAMSGISSVISRIADLQTAIAGAVEEQTATTNEMARNVGEAGRGAGRIAASATEVARQAEETTGGAGRSSAAAEQLVEVAADLDALVRRFRLAEGFAVAH